MRTQDIAIHPDQIDILSILKNVPTARFSDLKVNSLENDLLNYHLKHLIQKGFLKKEGQTYSLTIKGSQLISHIPLREKYCDLFKTSVALYVVKDGKILVQRRKRQPFLGDVVTIAGKIRWGETAENTAKRKLKEEAGLDASFKLLGVMRKTRLMKGEVIEDTLYHICFANDSTGELIAENDHGGNYWETFDKYKEGLQETKDINEGNIEIIKRLKLNNFSMFYFHEIGEIKEY